MPFLDGALTEVSHRYYFLTEVCTDNNMDVS